MVTSGWMQRVDLGDGRGLPISAAPHHQQAREGPLKVAEHGEDLADERFDHPGRDAPAPAPGHNGSGRTRRLKNLQTQLLQIPPKIIRLFVFPQKFAWQRQQVDRNVGKDGAPFGKPCGRESPDGDPLHPEQEVVVVETAFRPCRKEKRKTPIAAMQSKITTPLVR